MSPHGDPILTHHVPMKGECMSTVPVLASEDLTNGGVKGNVSYGTLTTIIESDLKFGLIYVGSDDGLIHVSRDGGFSWKNISSIISY